MEFQLNWLWDHSAFLGTILASHPASETTPVDIRDVSRCAPVEGDEGGRREDSKDGRPTRTPLSLAAFPLQLSKLGVRMKLLENLMYV